MFGFASWLALLGSVSASQEVGQVIALAQLLKTLDDDVVTFDQEVGRGQDLGHRATVIGDRDAPSRLCISIGFRSRSYQSISVSPAQRLPIAPSAKAVANQAIFWL